MLTRKVTRKDFLRVGAFGAAGALLASSVASSAQAQATATKFAWIMSKPTLDAALGSDAGLARAMYGETCYVSGSGSSYGLRKVRSSYVLDYRVIRQKIAEGSLGAGDNIVYIMENSPGKQTPIYQQEDLAGSLQEARSMCHSVGATLIAAPARSVLDHISPGSIKNLETMLANEIPATCARYADAYEIQAQQMEQRTEDYEEYVRGCAAQARSAAPGKPVLAGLTTNSPAKAPEDYPTAREISAAAKAVRGAVQGYWMNVPPHRITGVKNYEKARRSLRLFYGLSST
jgi:hypothetical protein